MLNIECRAALIISPPPYNLTLQLTAKVDKLSLEEAKLSDLIGQLERRLTWLTSGRYTLSKLLK